jgi:hypothetical protein
MATGPALLPVYQPRGVRKRTMPSGKNGNLFKNTQQAAAEARNAVFAPKAATAGGAT